MGWYVHFQISWGGGEPGDIIPIAKNFEITNDMPQEVALFFRDVISRKSYFGGLKGDFWSWGTISNYTNAESFIDTVTPFFRALWLKDILFDFDRVVCFCEQEQSENVQIYQLSWDGTRVVSGNFDSGFDWCWGQY